MTNRLEWPAKQPCAFNRVTIAASLVAMPIRTKSTFSSPAVGGPNNHRQYSLRHPRTDGQAGFSLVAGLVT